MSAFSISEPGEKAIDEFASMQTIQQGRAAILSLVKSKELDRAWRTARFREGLERLIRFTSSEDDAIRAAAIALALRIAASAKTARREVQRAVIPSVRIPLPSASILSDPKDREYIAQAAELSSESWVIPYLGTEITIEESGETVRSRMAAVLVSRCSSLTEVFTALADGFRKWNPETLDVPKTRVKRFQRIASSLRQPLVSQRCPADSDTPAAFRNFVRVALEKVQLADQAIRIDGAISAFELLGDLLRSHFSLATEPHSYVLVSDLKNLFHPADWPDKTRASVEGIATYIEEAIALLGRQGISDDRLREALVAAIGPIWSARRLRDLSDRLSGASIEVRRWLRGEAHSREAEATPLTTLAHLRDIDTQLAYLLRELVTVDPKFAHAFGAIGAGDLEASSGSAQASQGHMRLYERAEALVYGRRLRVRGRIGDIVEFSPVEHDLGVHPPGSRYVRIVAPLIERSEKLGLSQIVIRADVEPA